MLRCLKMVVDRIGILEPLAFASFDLDLSQELSTGAQAPSARTCLCVYIYMYIYQTLHVWNICRSVGVVPGGSMGRHIFQCHGVPYTLWWMTRSCR